jgi:peroxiredoxin
LSAAILLLSFAASAFAGSQDWSLIDTKGESFKIADANTAPTMLIFWATWCAPCKKELGENKDLFQSFADKGVRVLLIAEDNQKTQAKVKPYVESKGYKFRVLMDPDGEVLKRYGGTSIPYTVLLDKDGKAVQKYRGEVRNTAELTRQLDTLLGGKGE